MADNIVTGSSTTVTSFDNEGNPSSGGGGSAPTPTNIVQSNVGSNEAPTYGQGFMDTGKSSDSPLTPTPQEQLKIQMLQSPTAQWSDKTAWEREVAKASQYAPAGTQFQGQLVPTLQEQQKAEQQISLKNQMLQSPTAQFSQEMKDEFKQYAVKEQARQNILKASGLNYDKINPLIAANTAINANLQKQQDEYNAYMKEQNTTYREYISSKAPLSWQAQQFIKNIGANVGSWDVLSKNIESFMNAKGGKENPVDVSNYLKAREGYFTSVGERLDKGAVMVNLPFAGQTKVPNYLSPEFGSILAESPVLQAEVLGYGIGAVLSGSTLIARAGLTATAKESSNILKFIESKTPSFISTKLYPEFAPTYGISVERGLQYAGKVPSLIPKSMTFAERLVEPTAIAGGIAYIGYDIASSKTKGEAGAKIAMLGIGYPYAKAGFEDVSRLGSYLSSIGVPKTTRTDILNPRVEAGKETFPTTTAGEFGKFKQEFINPKTGELEVFHATSTGYGKSGFTVKGLPEAQLRRMDVPSLYVSPYTKGASTAFLRLQTAESVSSYSLKNILSSRALNPEIYAISGAKGLERIQGGSNVKTSREFLYGKGKKTPTQGMLYVEPKTELGGFMGEAQAVFAEPTIISAPSSTSKVSVKGFDVKITERKTVDRQEILPKSNVKAKPDIGQFKLKTQKITEKSFIEEYKPYERTKATTLYTNIVSSGIASSTSWMRELNPRVVYIRSDVKKSSNILSSDKVVTSSKVTPSSKLFGSYKTTPSSSIISSSSKITPSSGITPISSSYLTGSRPYPENLRPMLDSYWSETLRSEVPIDLPYFGKETGRRKKKEKSMKYSYKPRDSPIFTKGVEELYATNPLGNKKSETISKNISNFTLPDKKIKKSTIKHKSNKKNFWEE